MKKAPYQISITTEADAVRVLVVTTAKRTGLKNTEIFRKALENFSSWVKTDEGKEWLSGIDLRERKYRRAAYNVNKEAKR